MITEKELNLLNLSATKKDFYQIWNELLEVSSKLSERWDPQSTNETDPGIVLLKVLTAIADKLNYNIDKNTLEAFMPTAAQEESMRKLCDMMGYSIKYYLSATTNVTLSYTGNTKDSETKLPDTGLVLPMFSVISNADKDVTYVTTAPATLLNDQTSVSIPCIEGQVVQCESDTDNIISLAHLDESNRYYLPETQIAENGIFIYNISDNVKSDAWTPVDNLNTQPTKSRVYKFGFDSQEGRPYIQFPDDISNLIEDGLELYYIRTSGAQGNVSANTLTTFEKPTDDVWADYSDNDNFIVKNYNSVSNGRNPETIKQAYNAFKKTVGTFDTLVTCRDYMNKIYSLAANQNTYLVSNVIVSDIRDDINRAQNICSFNDFGLCYVDKAKKTLNGTTSSDAITPFDLVIYPFKSYNNLGTPTDYKNSFTYTSKKLPLIENMLKDCKTVAHQFKSPLADEIVCIKNYLRLNAKISTTTKVSVLEEAIIINNIKTALYNTFNMRELDFGQEIPFDSILECIEAADTRIKNVSLEEPILYTKFVTADNKEYDCASASSDKDAWIGNSLYNKLALRNIMAGKLKLFNYDTSFAYDFTEVSYGEVKLDPEIFPTNMTADEEREKVEAEYGRTSLAGGLKKDSAGKYTYAEQYPTDSGVNSHSIKLLKSELRLDISKENLQPSGLTLNKNEVIKFRAPNFMTTKTYPAYVNYFLKLNSDSNSDKTATPATFISLRTFMNKTIPEIVSFENGKEKDSTNITIRANNTDQNPFIKTYLGDKNTGWYKGATTAPTFWDLFINYIYKKSGGDYTTLSYLLGTVSVSTTVQANNYVKEYGALFKKDSTRDCYIKLASGETTPAGEYTYIKFTERIFNLLTTFVQSLSYETYLSDKTTTYQTQKLVGLYRKVAAAGSYKPGKMVDAQQIKYGEFTMWRAFTEPLDDGIFIQQTHALQSLAPTSSNVEYDLSMLSYWTQDGFGEGADSVGIPANSEYQLKPGEYLLINYTPSSTSDTDEANSVTEPINKVYTNGEIIRPNFQLVDSEFRYTVQGKTYAKVTGFDFSSVDSSISNPSGMYSLGSNEQIEIRNLVQVNLRNTGAYLYWFFDNETNSLTRSQCTKKADGSYAYTLKEGEYIYYTDERKQDLAYYGEGTEVILHGGITLKLSAAETTQTLTEIEADELGLSGIPWYYIELTSSNYITLNEYQYVTLTEGDALIALELTEIKDTAELTNSWVPCITSVAKPAIYSIGDTKYSLPILAIDGMSWEVRSLLEFETGPELTQTLYRHGSSITAYADITDLAHNKLIKITPTWQYDSAGNIELDPVTKHKKVKEVSFKTSSSITASTDTIYLRRVELLGEDEEKETTVESSADTNLEDTIEDLSDQHLDLKIKVFSNEDIKIASNDSSTALILHNVEGTYTKISMANLAATEASLKTLTMPIKVPQDDFALMMFYYKPDSAAEKASEEAGISISNDAAPVIYNYTTEALTSDTCSSMENYVKKWSWWSGYVQTHTGVMAYDDTPSVNGYYMAKVNNKIVYIKLSNFTGASLIAKAKNLKLESFESFETKDTLTKYNNIGVELKDNLDEVLVTFELSAAEGTKTTRIISILHYPETDTYSITEKDGTYSKIKEVTKTIYHFKSGLNMVYFTKSTNLTLEPDAMGRAVLIFADPTLINSKNSLDNTLLCYKPGRFYEDSDKYKTVPYDVQLLKDLLEADPERLFYYNCPIENDTAIDLSLNRLLIDDTETLEAPRTYYDTNNINNKFVISEIDADYLNTGIQIAKSSKR